VRWDPLLEGTVLAEGREVNTMAYFYRTRRAALRRVVVAPCLRTGRCGAKDIKGKRFRIRDRREPKLPRGSLTTPPHARSLASSRSTEPRVYPRGPVGLILRIPGISPRWRTARRVSSALLPIPNVASRSRGWIFALAFGGVLLLHSAVLTSISIPWRWSREKIDAKGCDRWLPSLQGGLGLCCGW
jgi:hypothetical protein